MSEWYNQEKWKKSKKIAERWWYTNRLITETNPTSSVTQIHYTNIFRFLQD